MSLESSMVYHLVYHYSLLIHINHLIFLNTYLFGVFLTVASTSFWPLVAIVVGFYAFYAMILLPTTATAVPYTLFLGGLATAAWSLVDATSDSSSLLYMQSWHYTFIGLGVVIVSLLAQIVGH